MGAFIFVGSYACLGWVLLPSASFFSVDLGLHVVVRSSSAHSKTFTVFAPQYKNLKVFSSSKVGRSGISSRTPGTA